MRSLLSKCLLLLLPAILSAHTVVVQWNGSPTPGITGYNIYRATTSGGPYSLIGSTKGKQKFMDDFVMFGATYFYVVQSVSGAMTGPGSAEASVMIPWRGPKNKAKVILQIK